MVIAGGGLKSLKTSWHIALVSGLGFAIMQLITSRFIGAELPAVTGSVASMALTILAAKFLCKNTPEEYKVAPTEEAQAAAQERLSLRDALLAWAPFILIFVFLLTVSKLVPPIYNVLSAVKTSVIIYAGEGASPYTFSWLATPGVLILIAAIIGGLLQKASGSDMLTVMGQTLKQMSKTVITLMTILAAAKVMGYSGMTRDIAAFLVAVTGTAFPLVAPLIGSIGTFVTGSATSSSVLFGKYHGLNSGQNYFPAEYFRSNGGDWEYREGKRHSSYYAEILPAVYRALWTHFLFRSGAAPVFVTIRRESPLHN